MARFIVALTGASGMEYGLALVRELVARDHEVHLVVSEPAIVVMKQELGWAGDTPVEDYVRTWAPGGKLWFYTNSDIGARIASGSFVARAMVVIPCTMSTLAAIAHGLSDNLIARAADVMLKEGRQLVLVPRETPLHAIHLRNMLSLAELGVALVPAMPAFYHHPTSIGHIIDFLVGKVLDVLGIDHDVFARYEGHLPE